MKNREQINCPLCTSSVSRKIFDLNCGNFDNSTLYQSLTILACKQCGHIYNKLSSNEIIGLEKYYNEEYAPTNIGSTDTTGDRPGSNNPNTVERYNQLFQLISDHVTIDARVLDIGCAMGGFLQYLHTKSMTSLSGIDPTINYVNHAQRNTDYTIKHGSAESIPFDDNCFDVVVMDQVLEHSAEPIKAFREAKRVLTDGGLFCIGIPDAARYRTTYFFDFFWFLMREHIQHFDLEHLALLAEREGFTLINSSKTETRMMSDTMILPNLNVVFRLTGKNLATVPPLTLTVKKECFKLEKEIELYAIEEQNRLLNRTVVINTLIESRRPVYAWGIGREFLYLYEAAGLKHCNIAGLIDANPHKRKAFMINGVKLVDSSILTEATPDSVLIISAIAHTNRIQQVLKETGCRCEVLAL